MWKTIIINNIILNMRYPQNEKVDKLVENLSTLWKCVENYIRS